MITILQEITDWELPNGIYHINDESHLVGYQPAGGKYKEFTKPMKRFSKARRKFTVIGTREDKAVSAQNTWEFDGSKGNKYVVTETDGKIKCNCPGFTFRGNCKHATEISETL